MNACSVLFQFEKIPTNRISPVKEYRALLSSIWRNFLKLFLLCCIKLYRLYCNIVVVSKIISRSMQISQRDFNVCNKFLRIKKNNAHRLLLHAALHWTQNRERGQFARFKVHRSIIIPLIRDMEKHLQNKLFLFFIDNRNNSIEMKNK